MLIRNVPSLWWEAPGWDALFIRSSLSVSTGTVLGKVSELCYRNKNWGKIMKSHSYGTNKTISFILYLSEKTRLNWSTRTNMKTIRRVMRTLSLESLSFCVSAVNTQVISFC